MVATQESVDHRLAFDVFFSALKCVLYCIVPGGLGLLFFTVTKRAFALRLSALPLDVGKCISTCVLKVLKM